MENALSARLSANRAAAFRAGQATTLLRYTSGDPGVIAITIPGMDSNDLDTLTDGLDFNGDGTIDLHFDQESVNHYDANSLSFRVLDPADNPIGYIQADFSGSQPRLTLHYSSTRYSPQLIFVVNPALQITGIIPNGIFTDAAESALALDGIALNAGGTGTPADTTPPSAVTGIIATPAGTDQISLVWDAATDNVSSPSQIRYEIRRDSNNADCAVFTATYTVTGSAGVSATGPNPGSLYYFRIRAIDEAGNPGTVSSAVSQSTLTGDIVSAPVMTPDGGLFWTHQFVTLNSATAGSTICYTTDGDTPTCSVTSLVVCNTGDVYTSGVPVLISASATLRVACRYMDSDSATTSRSFTIREGWTWSYHAYLKADNADTGDWYGSRVALDGDTLVVSAPGEDSATSGIICTITSDNNNSVTRSGAVYVYRLSGSDWLREAYIKSGSPVAHDTFGSAIAPDGVTLAIAGHEIGENTFWYSCLDDGNRLLPQDT